MRVIDKDGVEHEIDGNVCPPGYSIRAPVQFMDAEQQRNAAAHADDADDDAADEESDEPEDAEDADDDAGDDADTDADDTDDTDRLSPGERSYLHMKNALDYRSRARKVTVPRDPSWLRPGKTRRGLDAAADTAPEEELPKHIDPNDARSVAYHRRSVWLQDQWKRNKGPWLRSTRTKDVPSRDKFSGASPPAVDHATLQRAYGRDRRQMGDGEAAWNRMRSRLENAWRQNKRPFVPPLAEEEPS